MNMVPVAEPQPEVCSHANFIRGQIAEGRCLAKAFNYLLTEGLTREQAAALLLQAMLDADAGELQTLLRPGPRPSFADSSIEAEGRCVRPLLQRTEPPPALLEGFLSDDECEEVSPQPAPSCGLPRCPTATAPTTCK